TSTPVPERQINPEAHDLYLRGRYFFFSANDAPGREYLEKAIQIQPDYAAAWSGLADYYGGRAVTGQDSPQQVRANWEADARKAVELDDSLAEAHHSMAAWYFFGEWDCKRAEAESLRAINLNSNFGEAYHVYGYILMAEGRGAESVEAQKRALELDPMARQWELGYSYYQLRQFDAAINELRLREQGNSKNLSTRFDLAATYLAAGFGKEAVEELQQVYLVLQDKESAKAFHQAFQRGGVRAAFEWRFEQDKAHARGKYSSPFWMAYTSAQARRKEETLRLLEDAYREHSPRLILLQNEPAFDFIRSEPRFQDLVRKMGLSGTQ
ncbi:MAG: tetratricopeptide repeat protein, partial [Candidatus Sulfotelmatobacter sp.]